MNKVLLMGRLVRDPEVRYTTDGKAVAKFTLAVDRKLKDDTADFINCTAFNKTAEFAEKYLAKGKKIAVEGRWQTGSYTNKEGQKVYTNDCVVESMEFAESKYAESKSAESNPAPADSDDFMNIADGIDDEMPFT